MRFILGSTSPRRIALLKEIINDFETMSPLYDESDLDTNSKEYTLIQAHNKGLSLLNKINKDDVLITMDTSVIVDNKIYGKPKDLDEAFNMIKSYSDNTHIVNTSYYIFFNNKEFHRSVISYVTFNKLSDEMIYNYINNYKVLDKAGAYGIQDMKELNMIKGIKGSYSNIVGIPLEDLKKDLTELNLI